MKSKDSKKILHQMPETLWGQLLDLAYDKGFSSLTGYINMVLSDHVKKETKK